jgi:hypothetical protein
VSPAGIARRTVAAALVALLLAGVAFLVLSKLSREDHRVARWFGARSHLVLPMTSGWRTARIEVENALGTQLAWDAGRSIAFDEDYGEHRLWITCRGTRSALGGYFSENRWAVSDLTIDCVTTPLAAPACSLERQGRRTPLLVPAEVRDCLRDLPDGGRAE